MVDGLHQYLQLPEFGVYDVLYTIACIVGIRYLSASSGNILCLSCCIGQDAQEVWA